LSVEIEARRKKGDRGGGVEVQKPRILIVDDDSGILKFVRAILEARGYDVSIAMDGDEALQVVEREVPDLVVLDINMPKIDGFEVCRWLGEWSQIPVIMLSGRNEVKDKVRCLSLGADDYLIKPFAVNELIARVRAVLRRTRTEDSVPAQATYSYGDLKVDFLKRRVTVAGKEVKLTPTEYNLLREFLHNAGRVLTHGYLLNKIWGAEYRGEKEYLRVFTGRLRAKLEDDSTNPTYITTVPGVGYQFRGEVQE